MTPRGASLALLSAMLIASLLPALCASAPVQAGALVTVSGVVRSAEGIPVDNVTLQWSGDGGGGGEIIPDSLGRYQLSALTGAGQIRVSYCEPCLNTRYPKWAPWRYEVTAPITLLGDTLLDLTLPRTVDLEVHVVTPEQEPVEGAEVSGGEVLGGEEVSPFELFPGGVANGINMDTAVTDAAGIAHLTYFPTPLVHFICASHTVSGIGVSACLDTAAALYSRSLTIELPSSSPVTVSGVVRSAEGIPVDNVTLQWSGDGGGGGEIIPDSLGRYQLSALTGAGQIRVSYCEPCLNTRYPKWAPWRYEVTAPITLLGDTLLDLTLPRTVDLEVHVVTPEQEPVEGAEVSGGEVLGGEEVSPFELFPGGVANGINMDTAVTDAAGIAHLTYFPTPLVHFICASHAVSGIGVSACLDTAAALYSRVLMISLDAPTAVMVSPLAPEVAGGVVHLRWMTTGSPGLSATVYRRASDSPWIALGRVAADGTGIIVWDDSQVSLGQRYGYRLGVWDAGAELFLGETWIEVPTLTFALGGVRPNPSRGDALMLSFSLPSAEPAMLELFDLGGRRLFGREVGSLGAGQHRLDMGAGAALRAGVYVLRLTQGQRTQSLKAVMVR